MVIIFFIYWFICKIVESTDLAAVYEHGVLHLKDVDKALANYSLKESLYFKPKDFAYPVGLAYDPISKNIFITDVNDFKADIYAFSTNTTTDVPNIKKIVQKDGISSIEGVMYNPIDRALYWTDSYKNGIYRTSTIGEEDESSFTSLIDATVQKPRGITADFCKNQLYWTERNPDLRRLSNHNLVNGTNSLISEAKMDIFYQTLAYDIKEDELIWGETVGDHASNSSCNIIKYSISTGPQLFATFEKCYPFSLILDDYYIYWTDWAMKGIMRLSRTNPKDLIKLLSTPEVTTKEGRHNGAFGLVNLNDFDPKICTKVPSSTKAAIKLEEFPSEPLQLNQNSFDPFENLQKMYTNLRYSFIVSLCIGSFFMFSTLFLILRTKLKCRKNIEANEDISSTFPAVVGAAPPLQRNKKYKKFSTFKQPGIIARTPDNDGVKIDIEDCCQMTLCDTPCYTSLKKEGKSYFPGQRGSKNTEDKKYLLNEQDIA